VGQVAVGGLDVGGRVAEQPGPPGGRPDQPEQQPDGGRLAGPVGPEEAEHLARLDDQLQPVHGDRRPEPLGQPLGPDRLGAGAAHARSS
jgi:hypothetical protein